MPQTADIIPLPRPAVLTIRTAKPRDIEGLSALISALAEHHGDVANVDATRLANDLFGERPWITALVAEADGELIGYALLSPLYRANETARGMDLNQLYVKPAHRGTGIGRHLVDRARETAALAGCSYLSVSATTGNVKAHRFYERQSFAPRPVTGMRYLQRLG